MPSSDQTIQDLGVVGGFNNLKIQVVQTGAAVSLLPVVQISPTYAIVRKPAGSASTFAGAVITPDLPGLYQVTTTNAGIAFAYSLIALPAAALAMKVAYADPNKQNVLVGTGLPLQMFSANVNNWSPTTFANSLELASPGPFFGLDTRLFGAAVAGPLNWAVYLP